MSETKAITELDRGRKLGDQFWSVIVRDGHSTLSACRAAEIILMHCKKSYVGVAESAWNEGIDALAKSLKNEDAHA